VELLDAIRSNKTCRSFRPDPVADAVLVHAISAARFAPTGGNRQPVRFVVVRDPAAKQQLRDWYLGPWRIYSDNARNGAVRIGGPTTLIDRADRFAEHLHEVPAIVVVCAELASLQATDIHLGRLSIVGGASVYPAVQNFLLACRAEGLGTALTTLLCLVEPQVKELLAIPDGFATACHIAVGYPTHPFPAELKRGPVAEIAFAERFGSRLA
jgi:nitroreductase